MIVINLKNYKKGKEALKLAKTIEKYLPKSIICPSALDIETITSKTKLKIFAQHANFQEEDKTTGYNSLKELKKIGASGTLLNHSEHPLSITNIRKVMIMARKLNIKGIICTPSLKNMKLMLKLKPYAIAFEDPKLISTGKSITKYNSQVLKDFIKIMKKTNVIPLCGAGISSYEDVKEAKNLGCKGVLIASAIANSKNPSSLLRKLKEFQ